MRKYELTNETENGLFRIKALRNFDITDGEVRAGDLGGWVESEENLAQAGTFWVYSRAHVSCRAVVRGLADIKKDVDRLNIANLKYNLTITPQNVVGGCRIFTHEEFRNLTLATCKDSSWSEAELGRYKSLLDVYFMLVNPPDTTQP